jgi:oligopeptide transport system substrate-binding protein
VRNMELRQVIFHWFALLAVSFGCILIMGCRPDAENAANKSVFRMNVTGALTALDPAYANTQSNVWLTQQIFNGLVELDSNLQHIQPAIAKSWHIEDSGRRYRFILRQGIYFHSHQAFSQAGFKDGTRAVTASDVVYSFMRICNPATASTGQWIFNSHLKGVAAYQADTARPISGLSAPNDTTFIIELAQPFAPFLMLLTTPYASVVPREVVQALGKDFRTQPVGTGPFQFHFWEAERQLVLKKNPDYFESGLPKLDAVQVRFIRSKLSAYAELLNGRLDFMEGIEPALQREILDSNGKLKAAFHSRFQLFNTPQLTTEYIAIRHDLPADHPLSRPEVRQALSLALDRKALCRYRLMGLAHPATATFIPIGLPGQTQVAKERYQFDLTAAKMLLSSSGFPQGQGIPELVYYTNPSQQAIAEFIQHSWQQLGLQVRIETADGAALREMIYSGKIALWRANWVADYPEGENFYALSYGPNRAPAGPNTTRMQDAVIDKAYERAQRAFNDVDRQDAYRELEDRLSNISCIVPLYYYRTIRLASPQVQAVPQSAMTLVFPLKYTHIK